MSAPSTPGAPQGATAPARTRPGRQARGRGRGRARGQARLALLGGLVLAAIAVALMAGPAWTPPGTVLRVLAGHDIPGASFAVRELRLPRALVAALAGGCFGLGGAAFQMMLRNPLASPDIIGITAGAGAGAVMAIVMLSLSGGAVSAVAILAGLGVAGAIHLLAWRDGLTGARLILVGIGISAMVQSLTAWMLTQAPDWSLQEAMRWLAGSVNGATLAQLPPLAAAALGFGGLLLAQGRALQVLRLGDEAAAGLGVAPARLRAVTGLAAVGLIACATAATGPIAFVAFMAGPVAARITGTGGALLPGAALVGALLVLLGDHAGQFLLPGRYPVGVVTGALGAPWLLYLVARVNGARIGA